MLSRKSNAELKDGTSVAINEQGSPCPDSKHLDAEALYRAHADFVARFLLRLGVRKDDVADVTQDVFLVAHRRGGFTPERAKPSTWLAEIAFRVASDRRRKSIRRLEDADQPAVMVAASTSSSAGQRAEAKQALERVQTALERLTLEKRVVFILFELEGKPCDEIASGLDIPVGTVYSRLHAARREFAKHHANLMKDPIKAAPTPRAPAGAHS